MLNNADPEYAIHPEAVHRILKIIEWIRQKNLSEKITIRQAKWINRLHASITKDPDLYYASHIYSTHEIAHEISRPKTDKTQFDTSLLDSASSNGISDLHANFWTLDWDRYWRAVPRMEGLNLEEGE